MANESGSSQPSSENQSLAAFQHAAAELRFFKSQQWQVTNYASLAQVALASVPSLLGRYGGGTCVRFLLSALSVVVVALAIMELCNLTGAIEKERCRMKAARRRPELSVLESIHAVATRDPQTDTAAMLFAVVIIGALLSIAINVVRS